MTYILLGISGSPVKKGNIETLLNRAIEGLPAKNIERDIVHLSGLKVRDCIHCNFCLTKQMPGKYCSIKDDAQAVFEKRRQRTLSCWRAPYISCQPLRGWRRLSTGSAFLSSAI